MVFRFFFQQCTGLLVVTRPPPLILFTKGVMLGGLTLGCVMRIRISTVSEDAGIVPMNAVIEPNDAGIGPGDTGIEHRDAGIEPKDVGIEPSAGIEPNI
jgi:hypothetical protein